MEENSVLWLKFWSRQKLHIKLANSSDTMKRNSVNNIKCKCTLHFITLLAKRGTTSFLVLRSKTVAHTVHTQNWIFAYIYIKLLRHIIYSLYHLVNLLEWAFYRWKKKIFLCALLYIISLLSSSCYNLLWLSIVLLDMTYINFNSMLTFFLLSCSLWR